MFATALRIALSKSLEPQARAALERALPAAEDLERIESGFEERINASKAARGEKPTRLSKARKAQVRGYADDAAAMRKEQLALYDAELNPSEIVNALHAGLQTDVQFWDGAVKYTHPSDIRVVEELVAAKRQFLEALALCRSVLGSNAA